MVKAANALHVVLRVVAEVGGMRRRAMYKAVREASRVAALRGRFRIVHLSIQKTHVHLLVEADTKLALARGMQGFQISAARRINTALGDGGWRRRGRVFVDRYHLEVIRSPRHARNTLAYVLNNWRKHREDHQGRGSAWPVDPFSSGTSFAGWREPEVLAWAVPEAYEPLVVSRPRSWLLYAAWKRHGLISAREVPGPRRRGRGTCASAAGDAGSTVRR